MGYLCRQESHVVFDWNETDIYVSGLYTKGLIYVGVPIKDEDYIVGKKNIFIQSWSYMYK